jgi:hypothetical protein
MITKTNAQTMTSMSEKRQPPQRLPIPANAYNLFTQGKITFEEMTGEPPKKSFPKTDPAERKKSRRDEDDIQKLAMAWLAANHPEIPVYGNATANIFNSGGLYRKALPKTVYGTLSAMAIPAKTWGTLLDYALAKLHLKLSVATLEKDQAGAKFAQMSRTKALGAVKSWPDIQVCTPSSIKVMNAFGEFEMKQFHGLFIELKKPDASSLPWGKDSVGKFTTNDHLQSQAATLCSLCNQGYLAIFAIGYAEFEAVAQAYLGDSQDGYYLQEQRCSFVDHSTGVLYRLRKC